MLSPSRALGHSNENGLGREWVMPSDFRKSGCALRLQPLWNKNGPNQGRRLDFSLIDDREKPANGGSPIANPYKQAPCFPTTSFRQTEESGPRCIDKDAVYLKGYTS